MSQQLISQLQEVGVVIAVWEIAKAIILAILGRRTRNPVVRKLKRYFAAAKAIRRAL